MFAAPSRPPCPPCGSVAAACVAALREMNPFVSVAAAPGPPPAALVTQALAPYDLVLLCGQPAHAVAEADAVCSQAGVGLVAAACRGVGGWAFLNLHEHSYVVEARPGRRRRRRRLLLPPSPAGRHNIHCCCGASARADRLTATLFPSCFSIVSANPQREVEQPDGSSIKQAEQRTASYVGWPAAMGGSLKIASLRRMSKLYLVLRGVAGRGGLRHIDLRRTTPASAACTCGALPRRIPYFLRPSGPCRLPVVAKLEQQRRRPVGAADLPALRALVPQAAADAGIDAGAFDEQLLEAYACSEAEMPAVNAGEAPASVACWALTGT